MFSRSFYPDAYINAMEYNECYFFICDTFIKDGLKCLYMKITILKVLAALYFCSLIRSILEYVLDRFKERLFNLPLYCLAFETKLVDWKSTCRLQKCIHSSNTFKYQCYTLKTLPRASGTVKFSPAHHFLHYSPGLFPIELHSIASHYCNIGV